MNAATGEPLHDFARRFVQGTADVDAAGKAELFLIETDGALVLAFGTIELVGLRNGARSVLWSQILNGSILAPFINAHPFAAGQRGSVEPVAANEAQISSLSFRAYTWRFAKAGAAQATFLPANGQVGSTREARLISL